MAARDRPTRQRDPAYVTPSLAPAEDPWTLAVHREESGFVPIGTAVAISKRQVLTCAHVVLDNFDDSVPLELVTPLWVSFPKVTSLWKVRRRVARVEYDADLPQIADVAVLHLEEDLPGAVTPARLKLLEPEVLVGLRWWAFGFPATSRPNGNEADGTVAARLAHGWVRLDTESPYPVEKGFSGGGLWVPEYNAIAGIVGQALPSGDRKGDAQALTLAQAHIFLPAANLRFYGGWSPEDAGLSALAEWGWNLSDDPEAGRHWRPRGRGVMNDLDHGYRFQGRSAALTEIIAWLDRPDPDRRVLVVTGSPGAGKSAVLGRIVTTADRELRLQVPSLDTALRATAGSVGCAVHAKGKTALQVATEIARAVGVRLPSQVDDLVPSVQRFLTKQPRRFNVVIDAVDEATTPEQARSLLIDVVLPLVQGCGGLGVQIVCGSRHHDAAGNLLEVLDAAAKIIDLDHEAYFVLADLEAYAAANLAMDDAARPANPYADPTIARPVARQIAALAEPNFLIAGLDARRRGMYDEVAADPNNLTLTPTVRSALDAYLDKIPPVGDVPARVLLTSLAYAENPGWTTLLWRVANGALGVTVEPHKLDWFARSAAASFIIENSVLGGAPVFRLFHQALNDVLLRARGTGGIRADQQHLTLAFLAHGRDQGWANAPEYLLQSLPRHAHDAGLIDDVLADDEYLLHADLTPLLSPANGARTEIGLARARTIHLTPQAIRVEAPERAAMFSVTNALEKLNPLPQRQKLLYRALWASARPRTELRRLDGNTVSIRAISVLDAHDPPLLATAGLDSSVRIWNPAVGSELRRFDGHTDAVQAVCALTINGQQLLATGSDDATVRIWDPIAGSELRRLVGHTSGVQVVCALEVDGRQLLATGGRDSSVRIWDPATGRQLHYLDGHTGTVLAACASPAAVTHRYGSGTRPQAHNCNTSMAIPTGCGRCAV
ncbi:hypothetical protein GCM10009557_63960 [Virgisporangium ochraceum]